MKKSKFTDMKSMLKLLAFFCSLLLSSLVNRSYSQSFVTPNNSFGTNAHRGVNDSTQYVPTFPTAPTDTLNLHSQGFGGKGEKKKMAALYYDSAHHKGYWWDPALKAWLDMGTGAIDTIIITPVGVGSPQIQTLWTTPDGNERTARLVPGLYIIPFINPDSGVGFKADTSNLATWLKIVAQYGPPMGGSGTNIYNSDGTLTASPRTLTGTGGQLKFNNIGDFKITTNNQKHVWITDSLNNTQMYMGPGCCFGSGLQRGSTIISQSLTSSSPFFTIAMDSGFSSISDQFGNSMTLAGPTEGTPGLTFNGVGGHYTIYGIPSTTDTTKKAIVYDPVFQTISYMDLWSRAGGGGGSNIPPNRGSGFRMYSPQIPAFNSLFAGTGIHMDSTAHSGSITITATGNATIYNFLDYGGVNDGQFARKASSTASSATITCLTCTFTTTAHTGQAFRMDSAGTGGKALITTILSVTDDHHIVLNSAASTSVGAKHIVWGTDNGAAYNNVLDTMFVHGGGELYQPPGGYIVASALQHSVGGQDPNCQIFIPSAGFGDTSINLRTGFLIRGASPINSASKLYDSLLSHTGSWIETIIDAPDVAVDQLAPAIFGTISAQGDISYNFPRFENLEIISPENSGAGNGPTIGGVNCYYCSSSQYYSSAIVTEGASKKMTAPSREVAAVITNKINSETAVYAENLAIAGWKYGIVTSDHAVLNNVQIVSCIYGWVPSHSAYQAHVLKADIQDNKVNIYAPATKFLGNIAPGVAQVGGSVQFEDLGTNWFTFQHDVNDSSNLISGNLTFNANSSVVKYNGNLLLMHLWYEEGNYVSIGTRNWTLGDASTTSATLTVQENNNSINKAFIISNANAGSSNITGFQIQNATGAGNHGLDLSLVGTGFTAPFTSGVRLIAWDGPLWLGSGSTVNMWMTANGMQITNNGVATTPDASAVVDILSTTKGLLPPRMTTAQRNAISSPTAGNTLYCSDCTATDASTGVLQTYNGSTWKNHW